MEEMANSSNEKLVNVVVPHKKYEAMEMHIKIQMQYIKELTEPFSNMQSPITLPELRLFNGAIQLLSGITRTANHSQSVFNVEYLQLMAPKLNETHQKFNRLLATIKDIDRFVTNYPVPKL